MNEARDNDRLKAHLLTEPLTLPAMGRPRPPVHVFEPDSILAVNTALACGRPLLVRGEPGAGKSQLARAVAVALGRVFVSKFVDARTEAHDLLWFHDAIARLAEAQAFARPGAQGEALQSSPSEALALSRFIVPGPLWWALNWERAERHVAAVKVHAPKHDETCDPKNGVVLLLDEIDKADSSVPNGLLEALGQGTFDVPGFDAPIVAAGPPPLVMLTTNEDRVLPDAFVRRCVVLYMRLPPREPEPGSNEPGLVEWLMIRGRAHFGAEVPEDIYRKAAEQLAANRVHVQGSHRCPPGLAEYIDLLTALADEPGDDMGERLERIAPFLLRKHIMPESRVRR
jgi:MoxR-like ATPase